MTFAFIPDDGRPNRIMRFVDPGALGDNVLCVLDYSQNILTIDRELYQSLDHRTQQEVLRTHAASIEVDARVTTPRAA